MSDNNVAARLKLFLDFKGLSNSQFADLCGIPRPTLSQLFSGRNKKISDILIGQIHGIFPELSVVWLLFGEGEMLVGNGASAASSANADGGFSGDISGATENNSDSGANLFSGASMAAETEEMPTYGGRIVEYDSLDALGNTPFSANQSVGQRDTSNYRIRELERKIANLKKNPRKVVQITVYYDDNTFETFKPA